MSAASSTPHGAVGRPIRLDALVLPGARLEPRADPGRTAPVVIRIIDAAPHGDRFRYEIEVTGLEPGTHDLRDHLVREDGTPTTDLPALPVTVESVLAAGAPRVSDPIPVPVTGLGGYAVTATLVAAAWLAGLLALVWLLRRRRPRPGAAAPETTPSDRLGALVSAAAGRMLEPAEQAEAERLVYDAWRRELALDDADPRDLVAGLRRDPRAARAIDLLTAWLHAPPEEPSSPAPADVAAFVAGLIPPGSSGGEGAR